MIFLAFNLPLDNMSLLFKNWFQYRENKWYSLKSPYNMIITPNQRRALRHIHWGLKVNIYLKIILTSKHWINFKMTWYLSLIFLDILMDIPAEQMFLSRYLKHFMSRCFDYRKIHNDWAKLINFHWPAKLSPL